MDIDLEALQKAIENGEIDLDAKDDTAAADDAPDALKSVITKLQPVATIRNASVYVAEVHKYLAGQPDNPGYVKHLRDMIKRLDDYYDAAANKMDEFRSGFLRADSNGSKFILTTPISDGQLISVAYGPSRSEDIVTNFIFGQYLPGVWADMIDERDVDGAGAPLSAYGPDVHDKLRKILAIWEDAETNTSAFLGKMHKNDGDNRSISN